MRSPTQDLTLEALVRKQYDRLATRYDRRWNHYIKGTLRFFKDWAAVLPEEVLLDVACGTGELERLLLEQNPDQQIVGLDLSSEMLEQAHRKLQGFPGLAFQVGTARSLPFPDAQFDVVLSANSFHYFEDPEGVLQEMHRVLKPDGRLLILDWCRDGWLCQACDWLLQWFDSAHRQCYTQAELHQFITTNHLEMVRAEKFRLNWLWELMVVDARPQ